MNRKSLYRVSNKDFLAAIKSSSNIFQALKKMGLNGRGRAYSIFRKRCKELNIDESLYFEATNHSDRGQRLILTDKEVISACQNNLSRASSLKELKLNPESGSNIRWINNKILSLNIDTSHWLGQGYLKGKTHSWNKKIPLEEILVEDSHYNNSQLKARLIKEDLLNYACYECGISIWNNKPISLQLEHKNGNHHDNRIENLTLLCPNCHSQTDTFCRKK